MPRAKKTEIETEIAVENKAKRKFGDLQWIMFEIHSVPGSPLLMRNAQQMTSEQEEVSITTTRNRMSRAEEAESGVYRLQDGQIYMPATNFKLSMATGAKRHVVGAGKDKMTGPTAVHAGVFVVPPEPIILFDPKTSDPIRDYKIDVRRVSMKSGYTKVSVPRSRAMIEEWMCEIKFQYEPLIIGPELITEFFERAGVICGIGDYRVEKGGPFGRYTCERVKL